MEVQYIFVITAIIITLVYVYADKVFAFADQGVSYLLTLATDDSYKLNNDPTIMEILRDRDLPNMRLFVIQRNRIKSLLAAAIIINVINYAIYPYDVLLYQWMVYIIVGACIITSLDAFLMFFNIRNNKKVVDKICTSYYNITLAHEELEDTIISIDKAFDELMEDLNKVIMAEDKNKNDNNEK